MKPISCWEIYQRYLFFKNIDRSRLNKLTHLSNFKQSIFCKQIPPKNVHITTASRGIFFAVNAQIFLIFLLYLAISSFLIFHTKILPISSNCLQKADIFSSKQNCTPARRPFHSEATYSLLPSCFAARCYYAKGLLFTMYIGTIVWLKINLLRAGF